VGGFDGGVQWSSDMRHIIGQFGLNRRLGWASRHGRAGWPGWTGWPFWPGRLIQLAGSAAVVGIVLAAAMPVRADLRAVPSSSAGPPSVIQAPQPTGPGRPSPPDPGREDELDRLLLDRPPVPITKPRNYKRPPRRPDLPVPGSVVVNRLCRITYRPDTGWYLLTFLPPATDKSAAGAGSGTGRTVRTARLARPAGAWVTTPRWVLPSKWLEAIERNLAGRRSGLFEVTGETTVYKGRVFICLRNVKRSRRDDAPPTARPVAPGQAGRAGLAGAALTARSAGPARLARLARPAVGRPATRPAVASRPFKAIPTHAGAVAARLLADRPGRPVDVPQNSGPVKAAPSVAPAGASQLDEDRGEVRADRTAVIELDPDGRWWQARFISDNTLQDQPVRLLPCKLLEVAVRQAARYRRTGRTARMKISGVISRYKGMQYMLLRKVVVDRDMGQF